MTLQALTLDLDDTLWPVWPCIRRAEALLRDWLVQQAPATAAAHDPVAMRAIREAVLRDRPDWQHDLSALRREGLRRVTVEPATLIFQGLGQVPVVECDVGLDAGGE